MGVSADQYAQHGALENAGGFATNLGEKDLTASSDFMNAVLSGDATKQAQVLAPEISAAKTSAAQDRKTGAEFGTRSGGTTAANNAATDKVHSDITDLLGKLTGGAASSLGSMGGSLLNTGINAAETGFDQAGAIQKQKLAKFNDIISSSAAVAAAPFTGGASLGGLTSGGGTGGTPFSMPGGGSNRIDPASFTDLMNSGTVAPQTLDTSSLFVGG